MSFGFPSKKKYKVGDKVTFWEGFTSHEYEILSKRGANAMNKHQPESLSDMRKFSRRKRSR